MKVFSFIKSFLNFKKLFFLRQQVSRKNSQRANFCLADFVAPIGTKNDFIGGFLVLTLWVWLLGVVLYFGQCWSVVIASMTLVNKRRK